MVFIRTSPFRQDRQYSRFINVPLRRPTADTACIVDAALAGLQVHQDEPDWRDGRGKNRGRLMSSQNHLNQRFGLGTVQFASAGLLAHGHSLKT